MTPVAPAPIQPPLLRKVPPSLAAEACELFDQYRRMEITPAEYNRRFAELQAKMSAARMEQE